MAKQSWSAADILCPFYIGDDSSGKTIQCEGCADGMSLQLRFRRLAQRQEYMGKHCCGVYRRCEIYKATMTKYPTDF